MDVRHQLLTDDHLDLLVTAAVQWRLLLHTPDALPETRSPILQATATQAGRLIRQANHAAAARQPGPRRTRVEADGYLFHPVEHLVPVEVLKATHAAADCCALAPAWNGSQPQRLLSAVRDAATQRVEGYAEAPWMWSRPQVRSGNPVAFTPCGTWRPAVEGLTWVGPEELLDQWEKAAMILVTVDGAHALPATTARAGVHLLAPEGATSAQVWDAIEEFHPEQVLYWPACREWLSEQVQSPSPRYVEFRSGPA